MILTIVDTSGTMMLRAHDLGYVGCPVSATKIPTHLLTPVNATVQSLIQHGCILYSKRCGYNQLDPRQRRTCEVYQHSHM